MIRGLSRKNLIRNMRKANRGTTLVELIVTFTLLMILMGSLISVIMPTVNIYKDTKSRNRAQFVADSVVQAIRSECAGAAISSRTSVRLGSYDAASDTITISNPDERGAALILERSGGYSEMLSTEYVITPTDWNAVYANESETKTPVINEMASKAIYRLSGEAEALSSMPECGEGYLHYAYYKSEDNIPSGSESGIEAEAKYDFTNAFSEAVYDGYTVSVIFHDIEYTAAGSTSGGKMSDLEENQRPCFVKADIYIYLGGEQKYQRLNVVFPFNMDNVSG